MKPLTANQKLTFAGRVDRMFDDPDLTGDVLLLALACYRLLIGGKDNTNAKMSAVYPLTGWTAQQLRKAIRDDAPRYTPDRSEAEVCAAPMVRREGLCGKPAAHTRLDFHDPETGEITVRGACSRHWPDLNSAHRANRADWLANGSPKPEPNTGGVLPRYFDTDWLAFYKWAGAWGLSDTLPTVAPTDRKLRLVTTDDPEITDTPRPSFTVITGGTP